MRFVSAATRAKYVVVPKYTVMNGPNQTAVPGLTARFFGHVFDSQKSQRELGWTDEEREKVENYLLGHRDFNRHGGFYLENAADLAVPRELGAKRCIAFFRNEAGESEQCPREPVEGKDYCDEHAAMMMAAEGRS
jgi:hypothetical protein